MSEKRPKFLLLDTYLAMAQASVGSKMFRKSYFRVNGRKNDLLKDGELSSAFFVSSILTVLGLIDASHTTVSGTILDLEKSGWEKTTTPTPGAVIVWAPREQKNGAHRHLGIFLGKGFVISHRDTSRTPLRHKVNFRTVEFFLSHPLLEE